jgi:hypothetical protein
VALLSAFVVGTVPNKTWVTPVKCSPVIVTVAPPVLAPDEGVTDEMEGCGVTKV